MRMRLDWIPNAITLARMAVAPPLAWLIFAGREADALLLAAIAGASDGIDGWLARRNGWTSRLGGLLDPIADKLLLSAGYVGFAITGLLPLWLCLLVLGRDVVIVGGAVAYHALVEPLAAAPSRLSKITTALQIGLAVAVLAVAADVLTPPPTMLDVAIVVVALCTAASGVHYVFVWSARTRAVLRARAGASS
jgi:cardiolipin synthase